MPSCHLLNIKNITCSLALQLIQDDWTEMLLQSFSPFTDVGIWGQSCNNHYSLCLKQCSYVLIFLWVSLYCFSQIASPSFDQDWISLLFEMHPNPKYTSVSQVHSNIQKASRKFFWLVCLWLINVLATAPYIQGAETRSRGNCCVKVFVLSSVHQRNWAAASTGK